MRKFSNSLNADYPRAIFIEKVIQYAKAFWLKQRLFGVFVTNCCVCCKFATNTWLFSVKSFVGAVCDREWWCLLIAVTDRSYKIKTHGITLFYGS